jgi:uncharacterized membrane protein
MASVSLQFQAARDPALTIVLLAAIAAVLIGWGIWQLVLGSKYHGLMSLIAGAGGVAGAGAIVLSDSGGLWMALLAAEVALAVAVFYSMVYGYLGRGRLAGLMALRCAAILALMLLLFKPALSVSAPPAGDRPGLPILVDRSGSMATTDEVNLPDRYHQCLQMLQAQQRRLGRSFTPLWYQFARSARQVKSLDALAALSAGGEGADGTDLAGAIRAATGKGDGRNTAGIVILTDGIHNAGNNVLDAGVEARVPIYAVAVGSAAEKLSARRNVELASVDAPLEAVVNNVTTIAAAVRVAGFATVPLELRLVEEPGQTPLDTRRLWTDQNVATLKADLKWTPKDDPAGGAGPVRKLRVSVPANAAEASGDDNAGELHVLLTEPRVRVLYVEGSIRPEYKFLKRLLMGDPNIRFLSLVRIAGNRFWAQGGAGAASLDRLPETEGDFKLFDVIVLGDLDRTFLSREQMAQIRKFVNDGGALLMLGGHNSFGPGGYAGTDVEAVLPLTCGPRSQPQETTAFIPQLTAAGESHPVFAGVAPFFFGPAGRKPDENLPKLEALLGCVTVPAAKPGASVLAIHPTRQIDGQPLVVAAVQRFGAGRSAAFTADTTWQWDPPMRGMGRQSPYDRFWGQLIRWLANVETKSREAKPAVMIRPDKSCIRIGQGNVKVIALVQDDRGRPAQNSQVTLTVTPVAPPGKAETLPMSPRTGEKLFEAEYTPTRDGTFKLEAVAIDDAARRLGEDAQQLVVLPFSAETDRLGRNDALLEMLADKTRGRKLDISGLPDLIDGIVQRLKDRGQLDEPAAASITPLFNFPILFVTFVALLTTEWLLRRQWHLR